MDGRTERRYPVNEMDREILRSQVKENLINSIGLLSLPLNEALAIIGEVELEIYEEASRYATFDDYFSEN